MFFQKGNPVTNNKSYRLLFFPHLWLSVTQKDKKAIPAKNSEMPVRFNKAHGATSIFIDHFLQTFHFAHRLIFSLLSNYCY